MSLPLSAPVPRWMYIGGEAGYLLGHPDSKWTRTGAAIDDSVWLTGEPNNAGEFCVMVTEIHALLVDTGCSGHINSQDIHVLCE